jgi:hypothetical protein
MEDNMKHGETMAVVTAKLTDEIEGVIWEIFNASPDMVKLTPFEILTCIHTASFDAAERYHQTKISAIGGKTNCESYEGAGV